MPRAVTNEQPVLAFVFDLGQVAAKPVTRQVIVAYDEIYSIKYFGRKLRPYWRRNGETPAGLLQAAEQDYPRLEKRCVDFDRELMADLTRAGRRPLRADRGAGLSPVPGRLRPGRRREQAAAVLHQGKHQQRRHRHGGRDFSHGPGLDFAQPDAGQGFAGASPELRRLLALEVPQRAA